MSDEQKIHELERTIASLEATIAELKHQIQKRDAFMAQMQANLQQANEQLSKAQQQIDQLKNDLAMAKNNSSNSSKSPSSDIVKPPKNSQNPDSPRKIGGQPGHPKHERELYPPEMVVPVEYTLDECPHCHGSLYHNEGLEKIVQQIDIQQAPLLITEHRQHHYSCPHCNRVVRKEIPPEITKFGLLGPELHTLIAFMKGVCHASFSTTRLFLRDVVGVTVARSTINDAVQRVSESLETTYQELLENLPKQFVLNIDETGHKQKSKKMITWCFRAKMYALYRIQPSRSSDVLVDTLGKEFVGIIGADYWSAYQKYASINQNVTLQFCLAHFIRDIKYLISLPSLEEKSYGQALLEEFRKLFHIIHQRDLMSKEELRKQLEAQKKKILEMAKFAPNQRCSQNIAKRLAVNGDGFFTFISHPEIDPTNNSAEQAIRFVVIDRLITQGSRSEGGDRWLERIWTVIASCHQQSKGVYQFLKDTITSWSHGENGPSLIPQVV
jgi:transposase